MKQLLKKLVNFDKKGLARVIIAAVIMIAAMIIVYRFKAGNDFYVSRNDKIIVLVCAFISILLAYFRIAKMPRALNWVGELLTVCGSACFLFLYLEPLVNGMSSYKTEATSYNIMTAFIFVLFAYGIVANAGIAVLLGGSVILIFYFADYFVARLRGTPLVYSDIFSIKTAAGVAGEYNYVLNARIFTAIFIFFLFISFGLFISDNKKNWKARIAILACSCLISCGAFYGLTRTNILADKGFAISSFLPVDAANENGLLLNNLLIYQSTIQDEPDGYTNKAVSEIIDKYTKTSSSQADNPVMPNIIVVMNESFTDIDYLETVKTSEPTIPKFKAMNENCVKGTLISSILGGNTPNSEFEGLTGCTMAFLPSGSVAYQQSINRALPTVASMLKNQGYATSAIHIYDPTYFSRSRVYPLLGIDTFINEKNYSRDEIVVEYFRSVSGYAADKSSFEMITNEFEKKDKDDRMFNLCVTIQNHGGYWTGTKGITVLGQRNDYADEYVSLLKITDDAFADLIAYFAKVDEPTIVVMYGDHQPYLFADDYVPVWDGYDYTAEEKRFMQAKTPFVIWANYDIEETDMGEISINYLGPIIMKTAGTPMSDYFWYLDELREEIPVISAVCFVDKDGNHFTDYKSSQYADRIREYEYLQYNYLKGDVKRYFYGE